MYRFASGEWGLATAPFSDRTADCSGHARIGCWTKQDHARAGSDQH